jgi:hypothetical protein
MVGFWHYMSQIRQSGTLYEYSYKYISILSVLDKLSKYESYKDSDFI